MESARQNLTIQELNTVPQFDRRHPMIQQTVDSVMTEKQRILSETSQAKTDAEEVLRVLIDSRYKSERYLAQASRHDALKQVTGRSSMDNAIASTQRMIETLERVMQEIQHDLGDEDLALLADD